MSITPRHARAARVALEPCHCQCRKFLTPFTQHRALHASPQHNKRTRMRREMDEWFESPAAKALRSPLPGSTNYLTAYDNQGNLRRQKSQSNRRRGGEDRVTEGDDAASTDDAASSDNPGGIPREKGRDLMPFPLNPNFISQSVLSEELREEVYQQVVVNGLDITTISANYGIDIRRVAAVVRLKTIEKQWIAEGKKLAVPYNTAILEMLPQTALSRTKNGQIVPHESINDVPVHSNTRTQLFWPTSESRSFTREDAAKAFNQNLLPVDKRIPHPELVEIERWEVEGLSQEERLERIRERDAQQKEAKEKQVAQQKAWEERTQRVVPGRRWDFKFQDISVEAAGPTGRGQHGVGLRYGYPHIDRKRGIVKIPTTAE